MAQETKSSRIAQANEVILHVSTFGRRFFYSGRFDRVAFFEMTAGGRIRFVDDFTGLRVNPFYDGRWKNFSHGGTLKCLVEALAGYIDKGKAIHPGHFGPWTEMFGRDLWGYGIAEMDKVRAAIAQSPCIGRREEIVE